MEEAGGDIILEADEDDFREEGVSVALQNSLVEDKIRTSISQVVITGLINKK